MERTHRQKYARATMEPPPPPPPRQHSWVQEKMRVIVRQQHAAYRRSLVVSLAIVFTAGMSWFNNREIGTLFGSTTRTVPRAVRVETTVTVVQDDPVHPATFRSFDIPREPFVRAQAMVLESIGPTIIWNETLNPLRHCSATTQFRLWIPLSSNNTRPWKLQALHGPHGLPKTCGGDEIYVQWVAHRDKNSTNHHLDMGIALVTDANDGTYTLDFVTPPLLQHERAGTTKQDSTAIDMGTLTIYYDYTCGIGSLLAPQKERYARAGEVQVSWNHTAIPRPRIRSFDVPNIDHAIDLSQYDKVHGFGDSLMMQLVKWYKADLYWHPNLVYHRNVNQALSNANETQSMLAKFRDYHGTQLQEAAATGSTSKNHSVAVIIGSSVWDVMGAKLRPGMQAHLDACRTFVSQAQVEFPHVDFYWKSPSAIFLHRRRPLKELSGNWLHIAKYTSGAVPRLLHEAQKALMKEMNIPYLDLFDAYYLSAPWSLEGDCRHYEDRISSLLLSYYWPGLNRQGAYAKVRGH
jgi:hypothetical protein